MKQRVVRGRDEWERLVGEQSASGLSATEFCERAGIGKASFYHWRRRFRDASTGTKAGVESAGPFIDMGQFETSGPRAPVPPGGLSIDFDLGRWMKLSIRKG